MIIGFAFLAALGSCVTPPPMPEGAGKIKNVLGEQSVSIDLYHRCKPIGLVETHDIGFSNPYVIERRAIELNANTIQTIYVEGLRRNVRFWSCPEQ